MLLLQFVWKQLHPFESNKHVNSCPGSPNESLTAMHLKEGKEHKCFNANTLRKKWIELDIFKQKQHQEAVGHLCSGRVDGRAVNCGIVITPCSRKCAPFCTLPWHDWKTMVPWIGHFNIKCACTSQGRGVLSITFRDLSEAASLSSSGSSQAFAAVRRCKIKPPRAYSTQSTSYFMHF